MSFLKFYCLTPEKNIFLLWKNSSKTWIKVTFGLFIISWRFIKFSLTEKVNVSVNEVLESCFKIVNSMNSEVAQDFAGWKRQLDILRKVLENDQNSEQVTAFKENIKNLFIVITKYLQSWTENLYRDTKHLSWMTSKNLLQVRNL